MADATTSPSESDVERIVALVHPDPHSVLGAHPIGSALVVRAFRPEAVDVSLCIEGQRPRAMRSIDPRGLFEARVEGVGEVPSYRLVITYPNGSYEVRDPYAFLPTLGELDLHLVSEGRHEELYDRLGARLCEIAGVSGVAFAVWAPNALGVSVVGDFNRWDGRIHQLRVLGSSGIWELFVPDLDPGTYYKFEIRTRDGRRLLKADPYARATEVPPGSASRVFKSTYRFRDHAWLEQRASVEPQRRPLSIYEVHLPSWRQVPEEANRSLSFREIAHALADYVNDMGFTHVELMPVMEHPFGGSWGYQSTGYFAPTARGGSPDDFRYFVDTLHQQGIGVLLDWVPAHFPKDDWALGRFDGTSLYEHFDPREGEHPDWGTFVFNFGRREVKNFLLASALFWLREMHTDGLRVDAVASMLYRDYSRKEGEWIPNKYGGRENLEAIDFLRELNVATHQRVPGVLMAAEESTAWPAVSRPTYVGGLGFGFKWNMGWMHDTLDYFTKDPIHRRYHHNNLTFGLLYAWSENFILPLSHDEVVHGKGSLIDKMPGDRWQKHANLRALYGYMWAHPGRKLLFMGGEIGQWREWDHHTSLDWHLLDEPDHRGLQQVVRDLNRIYRGEPALWEADSEPSSFEWIDANNADDNVIAFLRKAPTSGSAIVCVANLSPVIRGAYRVGLPRGGAYREILNTDATIYGGSGCGNGGLVVAEQTPWHGQPYSASIVVPPLATVWLQVPKD